MLYLFYILLYTFASRDKMFNQGWVGLEKKAIQDILKKYGIQYKTWSKLQFLRTVKFAK